MREMTWELAGERVGGDKEIEEAEEEEEEGEGEAEQEGEGEPQIEAAAEAAAEVPKVGEFGIEAREMWREDG